MTLSVLLCSGAAFEQLSVPFLTEFAYQGFAEEPVERHPLPFSAISAGPAFRDLLVPDECLSRAADAHGKEMARDRFAPRAPAFKKRPFEPASGDSVIDIDEHAFPAIDAGRRIAARKSLHEPFPVYHRDIPRVKILFDQRVVLGNTGNFGVFQRCSPPAFQRATGSCTGPEVAAKRGCDNGIVHKRIFDAKHTQKVYQISGTKKRGWLHAQKELSRQLPDGPLEFQREKMDERFRSGIAGQQGNAIDVDRMLGECVENFLFEEG